MIFPPDNDYFRYFDYSVRCCLFEFLSEGKIMVEGRDIWAFFIRRGAVSFGFFARFDRSNLWAGWDLVLLGRSMRTLLLMMVVFISNVVVAATWSTILLVELIHLLLGTGTVVLTRDESTTHVVH